MPFCFDWSLRNKKQKQKKSQRKFHTFCRPRRTQFFTLSRPGEGPLKIPEHFLTFIKLYEPCIGHGLNFRICCSGTPDSCYERLAEEVRLGLVSSVENF